MGGGVGSHMFSSYICEGNNFLSENTGRAGKCLVHHMKLYPLTHPIPGYK